LGDFYDVPAIEGSIEMKIDPAMFNPKYLRQNRDDTNGFLAGVPKATLTFSVPFFLPTLRSAAGGAPAAMVDSPATKLLGTYLGGKTLGTSMDANASCTASLLKTSDANALEGCGVAWYYTTGAALHCRKVVKVDTDITLGQALPAAPAAADILYRSIDLYMANRTTTDVKTYQFLVEGRDSVYDCWLLRGGQCVTAPTFEFKTGERPMIKFTIEFAAWSQKESLLSGISNVTYTNNLEQLVADSLFTAYLAPVATPDTPVVYQTPIPITDYTIDLANYKYTVVRSPSGLGTVGRYIIGGESEKITGKFRMPIEGGANYDWYDARVNKSNVSIMFQIGSSYTTGAILIAVPCAQITDWQRVTTNGIVEQELSWVAAMNRLHTTSVDSATELANSPLTIHVF